MAILAGEIVSAARANRLRCEKRYAEQSSQLAVLTTLTDIPGCSITFTTSGANAEIHAVAFADWDNVDANTASGWVILDVDGVSQTKQIRYSGTAANDKGTPGQQWFPTLASAGTHTIKLRAQADVAGDLTVFSHTTLTVEIREVV